MNTTMEHRQKSTKPTSGTEHVPVLLHEVIEQLDIKPAGVYFDGTFGGGGYSRAIAEKLSGGKVIATDLDGGAIERGSENIKDLPVQVFQTNYSAIAEVASKESIDHFDGIVVDLGFSSDQIARSDKNSVGRGFSFQNDDDPLVMTLSDNPGSDETTAFDVVNYWQEQTLVTILESFGGEKFAKRIAAEIVSERNSRDINTVGDLVSVIKKATPVGYHRGKTHPATKTFQAIRIAVNQEYDHLQKFLDDSYELLHDGGSLVVVAFHGGENKIVRKTFQAWQREKKGLFIGKRPIVPTRDETKYNKRARSAQMRVFKKDSKTNN